MAAISRAIIHVPTGEFKNKDGNFECGSFEPQQPVLSVVNGVTTYDPDYDIVVVPSIPDPRTQKWNGSAVVAKTQAEIDVYDNAAPDTDLAARLIHCAEGGPGTARLHRGWSGFNYKYA